MAHCKMQVAHAALSSLEALPVLKSKAPHGALQVTRFV
jgi:hypothetical protein